MANVDYRIIIENATSGGKSKNTSPAGETNTEATQSAQEVVLNFEVAKYTAKTVLSGVTSRIGTMTGNYVLQKQISGVQSAAQLAAGIFINPVIGSINAVVSLAFTYYDRYMQIGIKNLGASESRRRSGNYLTDRNR